MPSVRGRERITVASIFVVAGTVSGASVGFVVALPVIALASPSAWLVLLIIGTGLCLDVVGLMFDKPKPPASGRQVPQEWSRLLSPSEVAVLYGARLGVGPLTILSTWTWWSVTVAAALVGPVIAALTGGCFGAVRLLTTVAASLMAESRTATGADTKHATWFGRLRSVQRPNWIAINGLGAVAASMFVLVGCGDSSSPQPEHAAQVATPPAVTSTAVVADATDSHVEPHESSNQDLITPVELEDVVRTAIEKQIPEPEATLEEAAGPQPDGLALSIEDAAFDDTSVSSDPDSLSQALMAGIPGFDPVDDPMADRFLDIVAASEIQPDPTEEIALLETRGFAGGWTRAFRSANNDVAVTSVYQFEDATEAEFYLEDGLITIGGYGGKFFDVEGLPGVRGFIQYFTESDESGTDDLVSLGAAFQEGPRWYLVYFVGSVDTVTPEVLVPAITAQHRAA